MDRDDVVTVLAESVLSTDWHFLHYHFAAYSKGYEHFLCASIADACLSVERKIPGFAAKFAERLAAISGKENYIPHFEQIIQLIAELYVVNYIVSIGLKH